MDWPPCDIRGVTSDRMEMSPVTISAPCGNRNRYRAIGPRSETQSETDEPGATPLGAMLRPRRVAPGSSEWAPFRPRHRLEILPPCSAASRVPSLALGGCAALDAAFARWSMALIDGGVVSVPPTSISVDRQWPDSWRARASASLAGSGFCRTGSKNQAFSGPTRRLVRGRRGLASGP